MSGGCPVPGCTTVVPSHMLMCREDWYRVPKALRDEVWAAWQARLDREPGATERHQKAKEDAVNAVVTARQGAIDDTAVTP